MTSTSPNDPNVSAEDMIRSRMHNPRFPMESWGVTIVRCTYSSQERFEEFMTFITEDAMEYLDKDLNEDLRNTFQLRVIEDKSLKGVTWKEARKRFDETIRGELDLVLEKMPPEDPFWGIEKDEGELRESLVGTQPDWQFFIFVDEASEIVVNCIGAHKTKRGPWYYVTFCAIGLREEREGVRGRG